jgi:hypothetical protein
VDRRVEPPREFGYRNGVGLDHPGLSPIECRVSVHGLVVYLSGLGSALAHCLTGRWLLSCLYVGVPTGRHVRTAPQDSQPILTVGVGERGRSGSHRSEPHCQHR